MHFLLGRIKI